MFHKSIQLWIFAIIYFTVNGFPICKSNTCNKTHIKTGHFRPTWIDINLDAVHSNVAKLKHYLGDKVHLMAVVKANAYGYGILEIAQTSVASGATWLGVATLDEAIFLRSKVSQNIPILVLGYADPQDLQLITRLNITVTCISLEWIKEADRLAQEPFDFHLKIDTGMNRLGLKSVEEIKTFLKILSGNRYLRFTGIFTHFATSEDVNNTEYFHQQLNSFHTYLEMIPDSTRKIIHCANSGATLYQPEKPFFNMVRLGKALTGPPNQALKHLLPIELQTALELHSTLIMVKKLEAGEKVSYLGEYTTTQPQWIGTIPIGYGDGWHQQFKTTHVLIDGSKVPIIGRITMDQLLVELPRQYSTGTRVTFIGGQGNEIITADEIAKRANQPRSEVLSSLSSRLPRIYRRNGEIVSIRNPMIESSNLP